MALLTAVQVAGYWVAAGGPRDRAVEWVAIAMGESGLVTDAVSPAGAIGIWQVMPFNAAPNGATVSQLYDPAVNARVTVLMSGGGANCAAWDSAYADIGASGRYTYLAYPEKGSADYNNLPAAYAELQGHDYGGITAQPGPGVDASLDATVSRLQAAGTRAIPGLTVANRRIQATYNAIGTRGWRP